MLGENGAGKTTTLRMIAAVLRPTSGAIFIDGLDAYRCAEEARRRNGVLVGGETGLYDRMTARENIAYFGKLYGLHPSEIEGRIQSLANRFGMREFLDKRIGKCSKGMKQKTAIARALVHDPNIILFDESTTGLDITAANVMRLFKPHHERRAATVRPGTDFAQRGSEVRRPAENAVRAVPEPRPRSDFDAHGGGAFMSFRQIRIVCRK